MFLATTVRVAMRAGGLTAPGRPAPRTAWRSGATDGALTFTGALDICRSSTRTIFREMGCAVATERADAAVTAPGTPWLTYFTLLTVVLLFTTFVL